MAALTKAVVAAAEAVAAAAEAEAAVGDNRFTEKAYFCLLL